MSATIPENMFLSDLLKSTGYDCPDSLKDKTFDESTSGGSEVVLENNKEATIDVSSYTAPVEITPTVGKDGMKKATVTLSNIPSGGDIEVNKEATIDVSTYTAPVKITPTAGKDGMAKITIALSNIPSDNTGFSVQCFSLSNDYITLVVFPRSTKVTAVTNNTMSQITAGGVQEGFAIFENSVEADTKIAVVYDGDTYSYTYDGRDYQSHELVKENS
jgi:hypothetical protein